MVVCCKNMAAQVKEAFQKFDNIEHTYEFLHNCVTDISNINDNAEVSNNNSQENQELYSARKIIQNFYRQRVTNENFPLPSELPKNVATALETVFKLRYTDIVNSLVREKLIRNGHKLVETFDWKLKLVLGSSKLASLREPICQVELNCINIGQDLNPHKSTINFECDVEKLDKLITVLSRVKNELNGIQN